MGESSQTLTEFVIGSILGHCTHVDQCDLEVIKEKVELFTTLYTEHGKCSKNSYNKINIYMYTACSL